MCQGDEEERAGKAAMRLQNGRVGGVSWTSRGRKGTPGKGNSICKGPAPGRPHAWDPEERNMAQKDPQEVTRAGSLEAFNWGL